MPPITPGSIQWNVDAPARAVIRTLPPEVHNNYRDVREALQVKVCAFINSHNSCDGKTNGISAMGSIGDGGKKLKVDLAIPGRGASRSLRVGLAVFCEPRVIHIITVDWRKDLPGG